MDGLDRIVIVTICSAVGGISMVAIVCFVIWFLLRRRSQRTIHQRKTCLFRRQQLYHRSNRFFSIKFQNNDEKLGKNRFNTSDSSVSLSFNPPHLINQNVKNLDKLAATPKIERFNKLTRNPFYSPSASLSPSMSNLALAVQSNSPSSNQQLNTLYVRFLDELNHILCLQQAPRPATSLRYSQSCRRANDLLPFDYQRSLSPSTITVPSSSHGNSLDPLDHRTHSHLNSTLIRKAHLAQIRDDTIVLY